MKSQTDLWPEERRGYDKALPVAYAPIPLNLSPKSKVPVWLEERVASLIAGAGIVWSAQVFTSPVARFSKLMGTPGPLEICGIGILLWLHAKWRRSLER